MKIKHLCRVKAFPTQEDRLRSSRFHFYSNIRLLGVRLVTILPSSVRRSPYNSQVMLILSLDTTSEIGGVAIFRDHECLAEWPLGSTGNYSVALFEGFDSILRATQIDIKRIDLFAAANGPGSFTGIRTGLAAVLGWSKACGRPARGVSVLHALVEAAALSSECAFPILDARRHEFYTALFNRTPPADDTKPAPMPLFDPRSFSPAAEGFVLGPAELLALIRTTAEGAASLTCVVRDHEIATQELRKSSPQGVGWVSVRGHLLATIARLALAAQIEGSEPSSRELDAYYLRRTDAETNLME